MLGRQLLASSSKLHDFPIHDDQREAASQPSPLLRAPATCSLWIFGALTDSLAYGAFFPPRSPFAGPYSTTTATTQFRLSSVEFRPQPGRPSPHPKHTLVSIDRPPCPASTSPTTTAMRRCTPAACRCPRQQAPAQPLSAASLTAALWYVVPSKRGRDGCHRRYAVTLGEQMH